MLPANGKNVLVIVLGCSQNNHAAGGAAEALRELGEQSGAWDVTGCSLVSCCEFSATTMLGRRMGQTYVV